MSVYSQANLELDTTLLADVSHTSLRPVRQIYTSGSHAFSTAFSRAAAIPPGSTSIPLPNSLSRTGKQPGAAGRHPTEHSQGTGPDVSHHPQKVNYNPQDSAEHVQLSKIYLLVSSILTLRADMNSRRESHGTLRQAYIIKQE